MAFASETFPFPPHPLPVLATGRRTVYALVAPDGRLYSRTGRWTRELREADLRRHVRSWDAMKRMTGGTVWRVVLSLQAPAVGQGEAPCP